MSCLTLPVLMDLQSVYSRQLRAKLKLDSYKVFQAAEHGLLISQGNRKIMFFKPLLTQVVYFSSLIWTLIKLNYINGDIFNSSKIGVKDRWFSLKHNTKIDTPTQRYKKVELFPHVILLYRSCNIIKVNKEV